MIRWSLIPVLTVNIKIRDMKRYIIIIATVLFILSSCEKNNDNILAIPDDITLNELTLSPYTHLIPEGGFTSGGITFNTKKTSDGSYSGFAYSNQNNRSYLWSNSKAALDTNIFSVYTGAIRNQTDIFAVACATSEEDCFLTLDTPSVIEHILFANTTYNYYGMATGEKTTSAIVNPNVPSAPSAVWYTFNPGVTRALNQEGDYYKIIIKGYNGSQLKGTVEVYLCCRAKGNADYPAHNFLRTTWFPWELDALGEVDKLTFTTDCSYKDENGKALIHSYFCIDGIRLAAKK